MEEQSMTFIRTVLGDISQDDVGFCYAHEHIIIDPSYPTEKNPDFELSSVDLAAQELRHFYELGGRTMVDTMPCDCGRNVSKLADVSRMSGVNIVCPTGLHLEKYYPKGHWGQRLSAEELAELFVADIEMGVDVNDYGGPEIHRTKHRSGVIKVAGGKDNLSAHEAKIFKAAALASKRTGCPIITHSEEGTAAMEQVALLAEGGVDVSRVTISHTDRKPELEYHRELLKTGVCLEYDSAFRWKTSENPTTNLIINLASEFPNQLMLGMDAARSTYWASYGGKPGLTYLLAEYRAALLDAGLEEALLQRLFVANPAHAFSFAE